MSDYETYSKCLVRSVNHIFKHFLHDKKIEEVYETQSKEKDPCVAIEIDGTLNGELVINIPKKTLDLITKKFINSSDIKKIKKSHGDVAGELANLITATFVNQLQHAEHDIRLTPPEFNDDPITVKVFYDNINLSFNSSYGGFDIDLYFREHEEEMN